MSDESLLVVAPVVEPQVLRLVPPQPEAVPGVVPVADTRNVVRLVPAQPAVRSDADDEVARLRAEVLYLRSELVILQAQRRL